MKKFNRNLIRKLFACLLLSTASTAFSASYPPNEDYGSQGDFLVKRGVEFGRTADLMTIGPILINLPEGPGSSDVNLPDGVRLEDSAWDLSDLRNPTMIRSLTCDTCFPAQPIHAHATLVRFHSTEGPLLLGREDYKYNPDGVDSNAQLVAEDLWDDWWGYPSIGYTHQSAPYYVRTFWDYGLDTSGTFAIRDTSRYLAEGVPGTSNVRGTPYEELFGASELGVWLGEPLVYWDHLALTGVTGFTSWVGNLLIVSSDQQATGMAIYDTAGFKDGVVPRLLSVFQPELTEPDGHTVGIGGYWVESYGSNKMVWASRVRKNIIPERSYPSLYVVDFTDPENPKMTCELYFDQDESDPRDGGDSSDPMYMNFQDQYIYADHFKIDLDACEAAYADDQNISTEEFFDIVYTFSDSANACDSSQYFRPLGQVGIFGGYDWWVTRDVNEQGMCFFVTSDEPDNRAPYVAGHRPLANRDNYPLDGLIHIHIPETLRTETVENAISVIAVGGGPISFRHQLSHTGVISVWPDEDLAPDTQYEVSITGIQDFMGNTMEDYSFVFFTGDGVVDPGEPVPTPLPTPVPSFSGDEFYPNKSSQLACQPEVDDGNIWVVNPDNNSVSIIAQNTDNDMLEVFPALQREIKLNYQSPTSVSKINNLFAVTHRDDDKVVFYSESGDPVFSIDTGYGSQPVASVADDSILYVSLYGSGEILKIDSETREISARLEVGPQPKAMALVGERLLVTRFISPQEFGEVYDINTAQNMSLTRTIRINKILVPDDIDHGSGVPNYLSSIVINDDASLAYISASKANVDRGLRPGNTINPQPLDSDNTVRPIIITLDLQNDRDSNVDPTTRDNAIDLDNGADPSSVTFLANPDIRIHVLQGNNVAIANNLEANTVLQYGVGGAPQETCTTLRTLYVKNFSDRSVSAVDVSGFMFDGRMGQNVQTIKTVNREVLSDEELLGLNIFYHSSMPEMGDEGYMSCATCHRGGGHDGRVWDITSMGEGLRNTISLNGSSGTRFGDLHWSGNFDEVQDFEVQMEGLNGGTGLVAGKTFNGESPLDFVSSGLSPRLDALAAYINGLGKDRVKHSPHRTYTGALTVSAQRGEAVFQSNNCSSCHVAEVFRDGLRHDVGTITLSSGARLGMGPITAVRTPTLIELWDSSPYFHDGSAATLDDVLSRGTHDVSLSAEEQQDLVEYLLSIDRSDYVDDAPVGIFPIQ